MPWSDAQVRLFAAAAHNPGIAQAHGMSQSKAAGMASEGIKRGAPDKRKMLATALRSR